MPVACKMCFYGRLWEILRYCAFSKSLKTSQNLSKIPKNSHNIQLTPRRRHAAFRKHTYHFRKKNCLCSLRRFCLHEGIGNRSTVSSPHTPQPLRTHFPSGFSATVSTAVYAGCFVGRPTTDIALWAYLRLACVARSVTYTVCSFACSLQNSNLPHTASPVFIGCALRACLVGLSTALPAYARSSFRARKSDFARLSCACA